jgi:hypothetical protein
MKKQIRMGVFETNSSMTHALTICTQEEYDKWQNGETLLNKWRNGKEKQFITTDDEKIKELRAKYNEEAYQWYDTFEEYLNSEGIYKYDEYNADGWFEDFDETFTTPSGDEMIAFGYYGHD